MTYRKSDSGSLMQLYKGGAGAGAGYTKGEQVETDEVYKLLTKGGAGITPTGNNLVKLVKVPRKSTVVPKMDNTAYEKVVRILKGEIKRLALSQTVTTIADPKETSYLGEDTSGTRTFTTDLFDKLSPQHAQYIIKSTDKLYNVYDSLTDTDWNDIMEDVGIIQKKRGGNTYTYKQIKEEAEEIIKKFLKERSFDSTLALDDYGFKQFLNKELKERRNILANSFGSINMTPNVRESDVISSSLLEAKSTASLDTSSLRPKNNLGLGSGVGAPEIKAIIQSIYDAVLTHVPEYASRHPEVDLDVYSDGAKKRRKGRKSGKRKSTGKRSKSRQGSPRGQRRSPAYYQMLKKIYNQDKQERKFRSMRGRK